MFPQISEENIDEIRDYVKGIINDSEGHIILVADILYRIYYDPKREARMRDLYIMPEYRQGGIAREMIRTLNDIALENGVGLI